jgi:tetrahydromethanopterin S-methyltransferase subunit G
MWFKKGSEAKDKERELDKKLAVKKAEMQEAKRRLDNVLKNLEGVTDEVAGAFK